MQIIEDLFFKSDSAHAESLEAHQRTEINLCIKPMHYESSCRSSIGQCSVSLKVSFPVWPPPCS